MATTWGVVHIGVPSLKLTSFGGRGRLGWFGGGGVLIELSLSKVVFPREAQD